MIDFLRYRTATALFSLSIIALFVGTFIYKRQVNGQAFNYSVDFTGGVQVLFEFSKPVKSSDIKEALSKAKQSWGNAITREFNEKEILVRVGVDEFENDVKGLAERMRQALSQSFADNTVIVKQTEAVGAGVGENLTWQALKAILLSLILMLLYIAYRFKSVGYAAGAVIALGHDTLVMLAVFLFTGREISNAVLAAVIMVLGYSINDTIIIFSRIRENVKAMPGKSLADIVNISINKTLTRTILTSLTTVISIVSMLLLGGEALRDLAIGLMVGVVFGTYSSIYIASPVMMLFQKSRS